MGKRVDIDAMVGTPAGTKWKLTLIGEGNPTTRTDKSGIYRMVVCQCECGNVHTVRLSNFMHDNAKSCGCLSNNKEDVSICNLCCTDPICEFQLTAKPMLNMEYYNISSSQNDMIIVTYCPKETKV